MAYAALSRLVQVDYNSSFPEVHYPETAKVLPWARGVAVIACDPNGLIAVEKPAGILSHPNKKADKAKSLLSVPYDAKRQCFQVATADAEGELSVYLLNRLDSATSGIVLLALDSNVSEAVLNSFEKKKVKKTYQAIVFGSLRRRENLWQDRLAVRHSEGGVRASAGGNLSAETRVLKTEALPGVPLLSRLTLAPITGRTHQLRIQTSKRHVPIVGDRTYGDFRKNKLAAQKGMKRLYLHCTETELQYTLSGKSFRFKAESACPF